MRTVLVILALSALLAVPVAAAEPDPVPVQCDVDDDLYNHCQYGPVHTVTGPLCAGVAIGRPAECQDVREIIGQTLA